MTEPLADGASLAPAQALTIAIDAMGGDIGPAVTVNAAIASLRPGLRLILVGPEDLLREQVNTAGGSDALRGGELIIRHAPQTVGMDEPPSQALRNKKQSSMRVAINLVKQREAHACVSAGNTGALMATARFVLKTLPGIDRPAICTTIPSASGHLHMLDLGANVDSKAEHLLQFGIMGSVLAAAVDNLERPKVALLNIGEEEIKGNEQVKQAASLLTDSPINYVGYIEGDRIFSGSIDVVVCDGFVGNVALKSSEGVAKLIRHYISEEFNRSWWRKLTGLAALPVLKSLKKRIDPRRYNGASLLGLQGIVIKSHGGADALAFANAIRCAAVEVEKDVPQRIRSHLDQLQLTRQAL